MQYLPSIARFSSLRLLLLLVACNPTDGPDEEPEVRATAQQLRTGSGMDGQVFMGFDLLTTDHGNRAATCDPGTEVSVEIGYSHAGEGGPFTELAGDALTITCGTGGGDFALVVDNSGSEDGFLDELRHGARDVIHEVLDRGGRASLVRVSTDAHVLRGLTNDRSALEQALSSMFVSNGWTALYDGIRMGNETLGVAAQAQGDMRYADANTFCDASAKLGIVAITDGYENNSMGQRRAPDTDYPGDGLDTTLEDLKNLQVSGITTPVYTIGLGDEVDHDALSELAEHTGGRHMQVERKPDVARAFDVIRDYSGGRHQVCTALPPGTCGPLHFRVRHEVTVTRQGGSERTRGEQTYFMNVPCPDPAVATPEPGAVATLLLALSDAHLPYEDAVRLVGQTARWTAKGPNPRVLVVLDDDHHGEHPGDTAFVLGALAAAGLDATLMDEPASGLSLDSLSGFDLVWFGNPGYPMDDLQSYESLMAFARAGGGVVLQGDDMTWSHGHAFSMTPATGLHFVSNGVGHCGKHTNDQRDAYEVQLADEDHPILAGITTRVFSYADDIDASTIAQDDVTVLAWATISGVEGCHRKPVIVIRESVTAAP